jgi:WD40 repeat protein
LLRQRLKLLAEVNLSNTGSAASTLTDNTIKVWDINTGKLLHTLEMLEIFHSFITISYLLQLDPPRLLHISVVWI